MKNKTLKNIFEFLKKTEDKTIPFLWKFYTKQPLTEDDLYIDGDLELGGPIESLPDGLKIHGDLDMRWTSIEAIPPLPKGLKIYGDLYLEESSLAKFSDDELRDMVKPGFIEGVIFR